MTDIHNTLDPSFEAEISGRQSALVRHMVASAIIVFTMSVLVGTASLIIDGARSVIGLLNGAVDGSLGAGAFR